MSARYSDLCIDALVGPTHGYSGLAEGNTASRRNAGRISRPRDAALQCLDKAWAVARAGVPQLVLPPRPRPNVELLRRIGFSGPIAATLRELAGEPELLRSVYSAASMWMANAATVVSSRDSADSRCHVVPANQLANTHRSTEAEWNGRLLRLALPGERFVHHDPLPSVSAFADEGAANHMVVRGSDGGRGVHVFVHGRDGFGDERTGRHRPRHTRLASAALARLAGLDPAITLHERQEPAAIEAGVFHNDVIAVAHDDFVLCHERAFASPGFPARLTARCGAAGFTPRVFVVREEELPLEEAVRTYLFNSQIVTGAGSKVVLLAPAEVERCPRARAVAESWLADAGGPIDSVRYVEVSESMGNGGGPACLRLRVPVSREEAESVDPRFRLTAALHARLADWIRRHYRETLSGDDLLDPRLVTEVREALDEVAGIFGVEVLYGPRLATSGTA